MSKTLVLAEKPSVARDIARVLGCHKRGTGYIEGTKHIITWALGHLVTLADPEAYGEKYKKWNLNDLPMLFSSLKLVVIKKTSKQYQIVTTQMKRKDVSRIVIATDAGREGELVARWIIEKAQVKKTLQRLWISSVTDKAIKEGFNNLRNGKDYENLYAAAVARSEADWFVGMNATRALTCKHNAQLSCGRVQSPTLAIIAQREAEIQHFKPKPYYGIKAVTDKNMTLIWQDTKSNETRIFQKDKSASILKKIKQSNTAQIIAVNKALKKSFAPQLYDLTELQRDAHKKFDFSAKETLSIMQKLYEQHKILTYPRTDSRHISTDIVPTLKDRLKACAVGPYTQMVSKTLKKQIKPNTSFVDDHKVSDHHAIIPTEQPVLLHKLTNKERQIYDLVVKRFLAVFYPPFEYEQTTLKVKIGTEQFIAKGKMIVSIGWKEVYEYAADEEDDGDLSNQTLPHVDKGDTLNITSVSQTSAETKPPARFNESTLLSAMENPFKYMGSEDQKLKQTLGKAGGLGTVATRADIIEKLYNSFLIERTGKDIKITSKGKQLLDLVPEELKSPTLTAQWEQKLEAIAKGQLTHNEFIQDMKNYAKTIVQEIKHSDKTFKHDNITGKKCPDCGKALLEVKTKKGKMLICQDRECGHRKNVSKVTNARCPNCRKKLELRGEGEGQIFACQCGHREKLAAFNKRKEKEKGKASKHDVAKYLKQQQKQSDEFVNPALAEALAKLKKE